MPTCKKPQISTIAVIKVNLQLELPFPLHEPSIDPDQPLAGVEQILAIPRTIVVLKHQRLASGVRTPAIRHIGAADFAMSALWDHLGIATTPKELRLFLAVGGIPNGTILNCRLSLFWAAQFTFGLVR